MRDPCGYWQFDAIKAILMDWEFYLFVHIPILLFYFVWFFFSWEKGRKNNTEKWVDTSE